MSIIAGFNFKPFTGVSLHNGLALFLYKHLNSEKYFVRTMYDARLHRGKYNYPTKLKDLLKQRQSDVYVWICTLNDDSVKTRNAALAKVTLELTAKEMLYLGKCPQKYFKAPSGASECFTVWSMTHCETAAVYYFTERVNAPVVGKVNSQIISFNGYVMANIPHANRAMYYFFKRMHEDCKAPSPEHFTLNCLESQYDSLIEAERAVLKFSRQDLSDNIIVLNKVCDTDALYYRNTVLKMPILTMDEYLDHTYNCETTV
jgi:hypothetical protein